MEQWEARYWGQAAVGTSQFTSMCNNRSCISIDIHCQQLVWALISCSLALPQDMCCPLETLGASAPRGCSKWKRALIAARFHKVGTGGSGGVRRVDTCERERVDRVDVSSACCCSISTPNEYPVCRALIRVQSPERLYIICRPLSNRTHAKGGYPLLFREYVLLSI